LTLPASYQPEPGAQYRELSFPFSQLPIRLIVPVDPFALADDNDSPDNTPNEIYWAESWPAGVALAGAVFAEKIKVPDTSEPVLELGCGLGLTAIAAAQVLKTRAAAGLPGPRKLLASDIEPRALKLVDENAKCHGVEGFLESLLLDWSRPGYAHKHRLILAADALYNPEAGGQLLEFIRQALLPGPESLAVVVDADRWSARNFDETVRKAGFAMKHYRYPVPFTGKTGPQMEMPRSGPPTDGDISPEKSIEVSFYEIRWPK